MRFTCLFPNTSDTSSDTTDDTSGGAESNHKLPQHITKMSGNVSMCKRARLDADAAPTPPAAAADDDDDPLAFALSREAFVEADTNKDGKLGRAEFLELAAEGLCPSAAAALAGRFGAADADSSGNLDPAEFHAALVAVGVPAAEVREWLDLRRSGDRVLVPHGEEGQQPGAGFRVTAAELELFETVRAMAEEVPRAVRYAASLSEPDLRGCLALFREPAAGGANFAAAADLGALARAVAACDFLGAGALPAAAMVWARLLPGAEAAAAEEAKEAFLCVVEQTSFGPALWAAGPLETVGRLAGSDGQEEQGDEHVRAVAGMALAELGRRILGMPDPELAMLRAHAAAPVAGLAQAELRRRYPQLAPMTDATIQEAVLAFCEEGGGREKATFLHSPNAEARYGPVAAWDVSGVQNMSMLFWNCTRFK